MKKFVLLKTTLHLPAQHITHNIVIVRQQDPNLDNAFWVAWTLTITGYTVYKSYLITLNDAYGSDLNDAINYNYNDCNYNPRSWLMMPDQNYSEPPSYRRQNNRHVDCGPLNDTKKAQKKDRSVRHQTRCSTSPFLLLSSKRTPNTMFRTSSFSVTITIPKRTITFWSQKYALNRQNIFCEIWNFARPPYCLRVDRHKISRDYRNMWLLAFDTPNESFLKTDLFNNNSVLKQVRYPRLTF